MPAVELIHSKLITMPTIAIRVPERLAAETEKQAHPDYKAAHTRSGYPLTQCPLVRVNR